VALFLIIRDLSARDGKPIFASADPELIAAVGRFLAERLEGGSNDRHRLSTKPQADPGHPSAMSSDRKIQSEESR
jgi:hypothetical protein